MRRIRPEKAGNMLAVQMRLIGNMIAIAFDDMDALGISRIPKDLEAERAGFASKGALRVGDQVSEECIAVCGGEVEVDSTTNIGSSSVDGGRERAERLPGMGVISVTNTTGMSSPIL
jgi:hypothetical protein